MLEISTLMHKSSKQSFARLITRGSIFLAILSFSSGITTVAQSRKLNNAQCILITSEQIETMNEDCHFEPSVNGSFTISKVDKTGEPVRCFLGKEDWDKDLKVKYPCIMFVSAWIIEEGVAEVRGLTTAGINSRWGRYVRDPDEPACWEYSSDLPALSKVKEPGDRICVYSK